MRTPPDDPKKKKPSQQETAIQSVVLCARVVAVSAVVDAVENVSLLQQPLTDIISTPASVVVVLGTLWKAGFAAGLYRAVYLFRQGQQGTNTKLSKNRQAEQIFGVMAPLWGRTAEILVVCSALELGSAAGADRVKYLWYGRHVLISIVVIGSAWLGRHSYQETSALEYKKDNDPSIPLGQIVIRNMGLCAGALLFNGLTIGISVFFQPDLVSKLLTASGVSTPVVTAGLLWTLRRALLNEMLVPARSTKETGENGPLWEAQDKFYSKVRSTFVTELAIKAITVVVVPWAQRVWESLSSPSS